MGLPATKSHGVDNLSWRSIASAPVITVGHPVCNSVNYLCTRADIQNKGDHRCISHTSVDHRFPSSISPTKAVTSVHRRPRPLRSGLELLTDAVHDQRINVRSIVMIFWPQPITGDHPVQRSLHRPTCTPMLRTRENQFIVRYCSRTLAWLLIPSMSAVPEYSFMARRPIEFSLTNPCPVSPTRFWTRDPRPWPHRPIRMH